MISRRQAIAGALLPLASVPHARAQVQPAAALVPPSLERLTALPSIRDAALSPDGTRAAILGQQGKDETRSGFVLIFDATRMDLPPISVPIGDCEVERVEWANDQRLLVWVLLDKNKKGQTTGIKWKGEIIRHFTRRVIAMDRDGQNQVLLFANQKVAMKNRRDLGGIIDFASDDGRSVLMRAWDDQNSCYALYRVDTHTGEAVQVERGTQSTDSWLTQDGKPVLRFDSDGSTVSVSVRAPNETGWKFYRKFRRNETEKLDGIDFLSGTTEAGVIYVATTVEGEDTQSIRTFDLRDLQLKAAVATRSDRDMSGCVVDRTRKLIATSWIDDRLNYQFTDPDLAKHYRGVSVYFSNDCNVSIKAISADHNRLLFYVSGPKHAGSYWLYDRRRSKLDPLGAAYSGLSRSQFAGMEAIKLVSRDGLKLSAYLTNPATPSASKRPLVVMPHGGPEARDVYDFDPFVQALAAEGWMVLQVNFRGSSGYGRSFVKAGNKRWGDLMQNDIEDALKLVIDRGHVDESRIAICGISYGGYAALMGAAKTPDRYSAVVSIAGVSDLIKELAFLREMQGPSSLTYEYWKKTIGDPVDDRKALIAASPVQYARVITAPVLLLHGEWDTIVGAEQSRIMNRALKSAGRQVDYFETEMEGHPNWSEENHLLMVKRSLDHIRKAFLGPRPA